MSPLLRSRRFLPYFLTQFFGAFNDNIFKNTLLLFVAFLSSEQLMVSTTLFINLAAGLFILPFFLFSASAGVLADSVEKSQFIRKIKLLEIGLMTVAAYAFLAQSYMFLLLLLFLMGTQSALFGPVKYALLPQQLHSTELVSGNALVETGTFLAILLGTLIAGVIASLDHAKEIAAVSVILFAVLGYVSSRSIPLAQATNQAKWQWRPWQHTKQTLAIARRDKGIFYTIIAISWFWFLGATYLTQFPNFAKHYISSQAFSVSWLLALFSIGIAIGSLLYSRWSHHRIELGLVPISALLIAVFGYLFAVSTPALPSNTTTFWSFLSERSLWPTFLYLLLLGASGGLFIVPLYTLLQTRPAAEHRAKVIASLNIYNSLFMVVSAVAGIILLGMLGMSIVQLFIGLACVQLIVALILFWQLPIYTLRFLLSIAAKLFYRPKYLGMENIPEKGGALLVCNHVSYLDALFIYAASPRLMRFVMEADYAALPVANRLLTRAGVIPINAKRPKQIYQAFETVKTSVANGELVCIFPEGRLSPNGQVQPFMKGLEKLIQREEFPVIPLALDGLWKSYFSRYKGRACKGLPTRFKAPITVIAAPAVHSSTTSSAELKHKIEELISSVQKN